MKQLSHINKISDMKKFFLFLTLFLLCVVVIESCHKDEGQTQIVPAIVPSQTPVEVVALDGFKIEDSERAGVTSMQVLFDSTGTSDNYLVASKANPREIKAFALFKMDSITAIKTSTSWAWLTHYQTFQKFKVANYQVTFHWKNAPATIDTFLTEFKGDAYTRKITLTPHQGLLNTTFPGRQLVYKDAGKLTPQFQPYRGVTVNNRPYLNCYVDTTLVSTSLVTPERYNDLRFHFLNIF